MGFSGRGWFTHLGGVNLDLVNTSQHSHLLPGSKDIPQEGEHFELGTLVLRLSWDKVAA